MKYRILAESLTDCGAVRTVNQDAILQFHTDGLDLFCVADGMGGHAHGERASAAITDALRDWCRAFYTRKYAGGFAEIVDDLEKALEEVNRLIYQRYNQTEICGSTVVALLFFEDHYAAISLGDSRIYLRRRSSFGPITQDDSWQNSNEADGLSEEDKLSSPNYDTLSRAVGIQESVIFHRMTDQVKQGDTFLLCSDGIYKYCREEVLKRACRPAGLLHRKSIKEDLNDIENAVRESGAPDNYSAVLIRVETAKNNES